MRNINRTIKKYGKSLCLEAYGDHKEGNGAYTVGCNLEVTTNTADALIDAGRYLSENYGN